MVTARRATVRQLLSSPYLRDGHLLGGEEGLDEAILDVVVRSRINQESPTPPGAVVILDAATLGDHLYQVDQAIRTLSDSGGAALVVVNAPPGASTGEQRLANRLAVPVILIDSDDLMALAQNLRSGLMAPELEHAVTLDRALEFFDRRLELKMDDVVDFIADHLNVDCCVLAGDQTAMVGADMDVRGRRLATESGHFVDHSEQRALHSVPITLVPGEPPSHWLVAESTSSDDSQRLLASLLRLGGWCLTSILATARVNAERDARHRVALLNEILDTRELHESGIQSQLLMLGWTATGWNTGLHIHLRGAVDSALIMALHGEMRERLVEVGIDGPLVERNDGWSGWLTTTEEPTIGANPRLVASLAEALATFTTIHPALTAHAGVGRPHQDLSGLRRTLGEAREASMISHSRSREASGAVHIDQIGVQRILMGWFASDDFADFAHTVLEPLLDAGPDGQFVRTLETYLDSNCSATATAAELAIHRNTVNNRIERVTKILNVSLEDPETRLSLQLACRMLHINH